MLKELPKVTVITITYNLIKASRQETFLQCVDSVKNQTYKNIEHIVIDGASIDGTIELIQSTGLQYYSEKDSGIYDAMNKGIARATGKYIAFLNSDDFWHGNTGVEESVKALEENKADFSYADCIYIDPKGNFIGYLQAQIGAFFNRMPFSHQSMFIRLSKVKSVGNYNTNYKNASDYDLTLKLIYAKAKGVYVENLFCTYRTGGYSHSSNVESANECAMILKSYYDKFIMNDVDYLRMYLDIVSPLGLCDKILQSGIDDSIYYPMLHVMKSATVKENEVYLISYPKILDRLYPKVTVITITYNLIKASRQETFLQCVDSVKNQTYKNIEHIVIDGASIDGTVELILSTGLQYYSEKDSGIYDAMNKGIAKATGKYIAFLNSDDFWHGNTGVEESVKALEENKADFSYADCIFLDKNNQALGTFHSQLSCFPVHMPICHQTMFTRLDVLKQEGSFDTDFKSAADYDLLIRLLLNGYKPVHVFNNFTSYRLGGVSQTNEINHTEIIKLYNKNFSKFLSYNEKQAKKMFFEKIINKTLYEDILSKVNQKVFKDMQENNQNLGETHLSNELHITKVPFLDKNLKIYDNLKRILLVFHLNFLKNDRGCSSCVYEVVKNLKNLGYSIDFFSFSFYDDFKDFYNINSIEKLVDNFYCCYDLNTKNRSKNNYASFSWVNDSVLASFKEVLAKNNYNYINIHYIQWLDLIKFSSIPSSTKVIYSMHDSNFIQHYYIHKNGYGYILEEELELLHYVDEITCISFDEMIFFKRFLHNIKFTFLPHFLSAKVLNSKNKDIDVLFLAYNNSYNLEGLVWFVDNVFPHLDTTICVTICGKIWQLAETDAPEYVKKMVELNINRIDFAEDLDTLFARTKVSIVPMFSGTGLKIKTIDALSRGIPVVSTLLGIDGFPDKINNCCLVSDDPVEFASNINNLINDEDLYLTLQQKTIEYFKANFSTEQGQKTLLNVFSASTNLKKRVPPVSKKTQLIKNKTQNNKIYLEKYLRRIYNTINKNMPCMLKNILKPYWHKVKKLLKNRQ